MWRSSVRQSSARRRYDRQARGRSRRRSGGVQHVEIRHTMLDRISNLGCVGLARNLSRRWPEDVDAFRHRTPGPRRNTWAGHWPSAALPHPHLPRPYTVSGYATGSVFVQRHAPKPHVPWEAASVSSSVKLSGTFACLRDGPLLAAASHCLHPTHAETTRPASSLRIARPQSSAPITLQNV